MSYRNYSSYSGFIVDTSGNGDFTNITDAIAAASSGDVIFLRTGVYAENITLKPGVNITSFQPANEILCPVTIHGKVTHNTAGLCTLSNINFQTNGDFAIEVSGSSASKLFILESSFNASDNTAISFTSSSSSSNIEILNCRGDVTNTGIAFYDMSSAGTLDMRNCGIQNSGNSAVPCTQSAGLSFHNDCGFLIPFSTSGTSAIGFEYCFVGTSETNTTALNIAGSGSNTFAHGDVFSGSAPCFDISSKMSIFYVSMSSSAANAATGSGTMNYSYLSFNFSSTTTNVATENAYVTK